MHVLCKQYFTYQEYMTHYTPLFIQRECDVVSALENLRKNWNTKQRTSSFSHPESFIVTSSCFPDVMFIDHLKLLLNTNHRHPSSVDLKR